MPTSIATKVHLNTQLPLRVLPCMERPGTDQERGKRIEDLMARQGEDSSHLARIMRVDRSQIYNWKSGKPISGESLERLAAALETTKRFIMTGEGPDHHLGGGPPALVLKDLADALDLPEPSDD
jgi:Cro/C1-type HTH DNA-binding domain